LSYQRLQYENEKVKGRRQGNLGAAPVFSDFYDIFAVTKRYFRHFNLKFN